MVVTRHTAKEEAVALVKQQVAGAIEADCFMVAVWVAEGDLVKMKLLTTWQFPIAGFPAAVGLLRDGLAAQEGCVVPPPLPRAVLHGAGGVEDKGNA